MIRYCMTQHAIYGCRYATSYENRYIGACWYVRDYMFAHYSEGPIVRGPSSLSKGPKIQAFDFHVKEGGWPGVGMGGAKAG